MDQETGTSAVQNSVQQLPDSTRSALKAAARLGRFVSKTPPNRTSLQSREDTDANSTAASTYDTRIAIASTNASTARALKCDALRFDAWLDTCPLALSDRQRWAIRALASTTR